MGKENQEERLTVWLTKNYAQEVVVRDTHLIRSLRTSPPEDDSGWFSRAPGVRQAGESRVKGRRLTRRALKEEGTLDAGPSSSELKGL